MAVHRSSRRQSPAPARERADSERVVVTSWGMATALGVGVETTFAAMREGRSGVGRVSRFDPTGLPCDVAGEVDAELLLPPDPLERLGGTAWRLWRTVLEEGVEGSALAGIEDRTRIAVIVGGHGYVPSAEKAEVVLRHVDESGRVDLAGIAGEAEYPRDDFWVRMPDAVPVLTARTLDARGPAFPIVSACAAGTQAIGESLRLLRDGRADAVVTGGVEPLLTYSYYLSFALLGALARRYRSPEAASRPFDRRRNGFVIAEGAAVLVLETLAGARERGRQVLGEVLGYGDTSDAFRITDVHPEGDGALRVMQQALRDAGMSPDDVEYVNAHGTSTPTNDPVETLALKRLFGERAHDMPVSSNKSMLGHAIGAAGAIEAVLSLRGMQEGVLLPTINQQVPDRKCDLDYVPNEARALEHRTVISNSFGFGGQNGCLCLGAAPDPA